jgi:rhodanese-related sulfurtransferase
MAELIEFANLHPLLVGGLFASWIAVMVYEVRLRAGGVTHVTPADAVRLINKGALVIDVNARNVVLDRLKGEEDAIAKKKDKVLLAVCENGGLSGKAANLLRKAGYPNAFSLKGGILSWRADNLPLVK